MNMPPKCEAGDLNWHFDGDPCAGRLYTVFNKTSCQYFTLCVQHIPVAVMRAGLGATFVMYPAKDYSTLGGHDAIRNQGGTLEWP